MNVVVGAAENIDLSSGDFCGVMVQYPNTYGGVQDWSEFTGIKLAISSLGCSVVSIAFII
jgi:glycine cleavage system pyridoxal-binding protein P